MGRTKTVANRFCVALLALRALGAPSGTFSQTIAGVDGPPAAPAGASALSAVEIERRVLTIYLFTSVAHSLSREDARDLGALEQTRLTSFERQYDANDVRLIEPLLLAGVARARDGDFAAAERLYRRAAAIELVSGIAVGIAAGAPEFPRACADRARATRRS